LNAIGTLIRPSLGIEFRTSYDEIKVKNQWKRRHHPWTIGLSKQFFSLFFDKVVRMSPSL
jgi:hypothetical protein